MKLRVISPFALGIKCECCNTIIAEQELVVGAIVEGRKIICDDGSLNVDIQSSIYENAASTLDSDDIAFFFEIIE